MFGKHAEIKGVMLGQAPGGGVGFEIARYRSVPPSKHKSNRVAGLLLMLFIAMSCIGEPVPEPPNLRPDPVEIGDLLANTDESEHPPLVVGRAGSVDPTIDVWIWNLDRDDEPGIAGADLDGGFTVYVPHDDGDELRIQVRSEEGRSLPLDVVAMGRAGPFRSARRSECFTGTEELDLSELETGTVTFDNECAESVSLLDVSLRRGRAALEFVAPGAGTVERGETSIEVSRSAGSPEEPEDILLVELEIDGVEEIRAVSVYRSAP